MPGEQSKTVAHAEIVWTELARAGMTRADVVVALGGGVVGDLAGFCAATYQRGVRYVQVPTTLVAQVDSAYGGKTGVDLAEAKNYVGAFHQPVGGDRRHRDARHAPARGARRRLRRGRQDRADRRAASCGSGSARSADPTDPERDRRAARWPSCGSSPSDERDAGLRQVLNLGHTVGHAIETATGYARYRHGEAVALGLLAALRLSGQPTSCATRSRELLAGARPPDRARRQVDPERCDRHRARQEARRRGAGAVRAARRLRAAPVRPDAPSRRER